MSRVEANDSDEKDETESIGTMHTSGIVEMENDHKSTGTNNEALKSNTGTVNVGTVNIGRVGRLSSTDVSSIVGSRKPESEQESEKDKNNCHNKIKGGAKNTYVSSPIHSGAVKPRRVEEDGGDIDMANRSGVSSIATPYNCQSELSMDMALNSTTDTGCMTDASHIFNKAGTVIRAEPRRVEAGGGDIEVEDLTTDVQHSVPTDVPDSDLPTNVPHKDNSK